MQALRENNVVGKQGETRLVYFTNYKGRDYVIAIDVGSNGFIVGANPLSSKELSKPYINIYTNTWYNIKS